MWIRFSGDMQHGTKPMPQQVQPEQAAEDDNAAEG